MFSDSVIGSFKSKAEWMFRFLRCQAEALRKDGLAALWRKIWLLLLMLLAIPIILVVRALQPLVLIRFGPIASRRIGEFAPRLEMYLCERDVGMHAQRTFDFFYHMLPVSNQQLEKMWKRTRRLWFFRFAYPLDRVNRILPGGTKHVIPLPSNRDIHGLLGRTRAHLSFTPAEERLGAEALLKMGILPGAPFVCFSARDSAYLDTMYPNYDWHYQEHRDANIHDYIPAVEELVRRGYFIIRLGAIVKEALRTSNPMIIDYATKYRTDFLDIYLSAKCRFYIGSGSGIDEVPTIFRRPIVLVNYIPVEYVHTWYPTYLFITKKLWLRKEERFLTFREILDLNIRGRSTKEEHEQYEKNGIDIVDNTPEEIMAVVVEIHERLKGTWQTTQEDKELQSRFRSIFNSSKLHGKIVANIGAEFLRRNQNLLDCKVKR